MTEELKAQQNQIERSYQSLSGLYAFAEALNPALSAQAVVDGALDRLLDLPGVTGGCVSLVDADGRLRLAATRETGAQRTGDCLGCRCEQRLLDGKMQGLELGDACDVLEGRFACVPLRAGGRVLGLLHVRLAPVEPGNEAWQLPGTVGSQIAAALERARLYADMEALVVERTEALRSERNLLSAIVDTTGALVVLTDAQGCILLYNRACESSLGWNASAAIGRPAWEIFRPVGDEDGVRRFFHDLPLDQMPPAMQGDLLTRDGQTRTVVWSSTCLRRPDGTIEYVLSTGMDLTAQRGMEDKLTYLSNFDLLTGLPNRALLRDRLRQQQEKAATSLQVAGFLLLHFERLRLIRETLGSGAEQELLQEVTRRLSERAAGDTVARYSESTFALVAVRATTDELALAARQMLATMERPYQCRGEELHLDPCVGITVFPTDGDEFDALAQGAERAMRSACTSLDERYAFYRPELNRGANERFRLESAMRRGLERGEFVLHYQPQVDLRNGAIIGLEALVRWQHPERGLVPPALFIGLAEETGMILQLGEWVLREACAQACAWQREGLRPVPVSVNLSARQFSEHTPETVRRILRETGLDPKLLELELTESASMNDPEKTFRILRELKAMGVGLAIDDFGTGYSNLNYLKRFPVDRIKLDQSFVRDIVSDPDDLAIARAVIAMAHGLRLTVIAEGVESAGQLALLADHGCDEIQGYIFSKPLPAERCALLLQSEASLALETLLRQPYERTLLYVDDEVNLLSAVRRSMRQKGYKVLAAANADEAFEILATSEVGVILCDQRMPGMSGTEFLARVKHMYPSVVRMVLSGYIDLQSVTDAVNQGAIFKFLTKPWQDEELDAALREAFTQFELKRTAPGAARP